MPSAGMPSSAAAATALARNAAPALQSAPKPGGGGTEVAIHATRNRTANAGNYVQACPRCSLESRSLPLNPHKQEPP